MKLHEAVLRQWHGIGGKIAATDGHATPDSVCNILHAFEAAGASQGGKKFVFMDIGAGLGAVTKHAAVYDGAGGNCNFCSIGIECEEERRKKHLETLLDWSNEAEGNVSAFIILYT